MNKLINYLILLLFLPILYSPLPTAASYDNKSRWTFFIRITQKSISKRVLQNFRRSRENFPAKLRSLQKRLDCTRLSTDAKSAILRRASRTLFECLSTAVEGVKGGSYLQGKPRPSSLIH